MSDILYDTNRFIVGIIEHDGSIERYIVRLDGFDPVLDNIYEIRHIIDHAFIFDIPMYKTFLLNHWHGDIKKIHKLNPPVAKDVSILCDL